jgi:hypothetical protein
MPFGSRQQYTVASSRLEILSTLAARFELPYRLGIGSGKSRDEREGAVSERRPILTFQSILVNPCRALCRAVLLAVLRRICQICAMHATLAMSHFYRRFFG